MLASGRAKGFNSFGIILGVRGRPFGVRRFLRYPFFNVCAHHYIPGGETSGVSLVFFPKALFPLLSCWGPSYDYVLDYFYGIVCRCWMCRGGRYFFGLGHFKALFQSERRTRNAVQPFRFFSRTFFFSHFFVFFGIFFSMLNRPGFSVSRIILFSPFTTAHTIFGTIRLELVWLNFCISKKG